MSVVVPARDERASIGACLESLLIQRGADLDVLVADDGSTDGTGALVEQFARRDPRVRRLEVPPLPPGWLGKNHAVDFAARRARGEWLLLTDADTVHEPDSLQWALRTAQDEGLDLLSLSPRQELGSWIEKAVVPRVYRELERLYRFEEINRPDREAAAANGQYILVRRRVWEAVGGHAAVRGEILEDVALARAVKDAGYRLHFASGRGLVRTRMYRNARSLWEGWTKNLYPLFGRRAGDVLRTAAGIWLLDVLPLAALLSGRMGLPARAAAAGWLAGRHARYAARLRAAGEPAPLALYYWPGSVLFSLLLLDSLRKHRLGRAVGWKGREYRAAQVSPR